MEARRIERGGAVTPPMTASAATSAAGTSVHAEHARNDSASAKDCAVNLPVATGFVEAGLSFAMAISAAGRDGRRRA